MNNTIKKKSKISDAIKFLNNSENIKFPKVLSSDVKKIEDEIDQLEKELLPLSSFILPSGHPISSLCHITRTVCRRAERGVALLSSKGEKQEIAIQFLNRLSDYLFVLSRKILQEHNTSETYWK